MYEGVSNVDFTENFAYILNKLTLSSIKSVSRHLSRIYNSAKIAQTKCSCKTCTFNAGIVVPQISWKITK